MESKRPASAVLRVFLSSTFVDLQAHRAAVRDIVGRLGQFTLAMEQFGAREGDAQTVSTDLVAGCDLYLGVIAWRYGFVPAGQERSVTHLEYEEAGRLSIPRLVFLSAAETQAAESSTDLFPASARDPEHLDQLLAFRAEIERAQVVDYFTTPDDLAKKAAAALHHYLQAHPTEPGPHPPRDLPPRAPGFVGHEHDLQGVCSSLRKGQSVAIVGMGGLGKSSLAAEALQTLEGEPDTFPGGTTWVRCDDRNGTEGLIWIEDQLLAAWGASLSAEALRGATTPDQGLEARERALRKRLRPDGSSRPVPALVLLDNVEHGLPLARVLDVLLPLVITLLLTSRSEPASPRVRLLRLEALAPGAAVHLAAERYISRGGDWRAERDEAPTRAVVSALGELPLAIELAVARAARLHLSLAALADEVGAHSMLVRLNDPLDPSAGIRYSLARTLLALPDAQRLCFASLGLPEGPDWPLSVIERMVDSVRSSEPHGAVAQMDLEALVAYSMVSVDTPEGDGAQRVRLHPLVRELAREEWTQQPEGVQQRALAGLLAGVNAWVKQHQNDFDLLARDDTLITATVQTAATRQIDLRHVVETVAHLDDYITTRVPFARAEELYSLQLESARRTGDRAGELVALQSLRFAAFIALQDAKSTAYARAALPIARELGDQQALLVLLMNLANAASEFGSLDEARALFQELLAVGQSLGDRITDASMLNALADATFELGDPAGATQLARRAFTQAQATGDVLKQLQCETTLASLEDQLGEDDQARQHMAAAIELARHINTPFGLGMGLDLLGEMHFKVGEIETAARCFAEALPYLESLGIADLSEHIHGNITLVQGELARQRGDVQEALRLYREASAVLERGTKPSLPAHTGHALSGHPNDYPYLAAVRRHLEELTRAAAQGSPAATPTEMPSAKRRWWPWGRK
jgi:tetratricopeptide (TPR) repeat protein